MTTAARSHSGMRVVHVCKVKGIAGAERHLIELLPALALRGVDVRLLVLEVARTPVPAFRQALEARGVAVDILPIGEPVDLSLVRRLAARLRELAPDLVHTHLVHADLYGIAAARRARIPAMVSSRHDNNPFRRGTLVRWLNRRAMRHVRTVIAISDAVARFVHEVEGVDDASIATIRYGVGAEATDDEARGARAAIGCGDRDLVVGFVGRLVAQKGVDVLIDAVPRVRARHPTAVTVIVGDGPLAPELRARAAALGLGDCVRFVGWIADARRVMPACDVIVVPSRWEGLGLVALEAMACARPVVASRVDGLAEIVEPAATGLLVPAGDAAALAEAVASVLDRPAWGQALGTAGRRRVVERFSIDAMADATVDVYRRSLRETATS